MLLTNGYRQLVIAFTLVSLLIGCGGGGGKSDSSGGEGPVNESPIDVDSISSVFRGTTAEHGTEPWISDGTVEGTQLLSDLNRVGHSDIRFDPQKYAYFNNALYVNADDGVNGPALWRIDNNGASRFFDFRDVDILYDEDGSQINNLLVFNDTLYIATHTGLWRSNGTSTGTVKVADHFARDLLIHDDILYFLRRIPNGNSSDTELWSLSTVGALSKVVVEGTLEKVTASDVGVFILTRDNSSRSLYLLNSNQSQLELLANFAGRPGSFVFHAVGEKLYFSAYDDSLGWEIWQSDGTPSGTKILKELNPGAGSGFSYFRISFSDLNNKLFVLLERPRFGRTEIYVSEGTEESTLKIEADVFPIQYKGFVRSGEYVYFNANDDDFRNEDPAVYGQELWRTDGTIAGTSIVKDINPGLSSSRVQYMTDFNGTLFFGADNGVDGLEFWKTDGTESGTTMVADLNPDGSSNPKPGFVVDDRLYFSANDGGASGRELWSTDGSLEGTSLLADINQTENASSWFEEVEGFAIANDKLFLSVAKINSNEFGGVNSREAELFVSDGTRTGTKRLLDINIGGNDQVEKLIEADGFVFFSADDGVHGKELWRSDGTVDGTFLVYDLTPGEVSSYIREMKYANGKLYMLVAHPVNDGYDSLWVSDGTIAGTLELSRFDGYIYGARMEIVGEMLFVAIDSRGAGRELWASDGTIENTGLVKDIFDGSAHSLAADCSSSSSYDIDCGFAVLNKQLLFIARDNADSLAIWRSNGSADGTQKVLTLSRNGSLDRFDARLQATASHLVYVDRVSPPENSDESPIDQLFSTSTSDEEPQVLTSFSSDDRIRDLLPGGELVYFTVDREIFNEQLDDYEEFRQIWRTDGTLNGTQLLLSVSDDFSLSYESSRKGLVYFRVSDFTTSATKRKYWRTDGTTEGSFYIFEDE